jgi:hypothetical protein
MTTSFIIHYWGWQAARDFGHLSALRGLLNSLARREPDANNLNETFGVAIDLTMDFSSKPREEIWRKRSRI